MFRLTRDPIDAPYWQGLLADPACGAFVAFEGRVRDHHEGRRVRSLEYEAYRNLALAEGHRILEAMAWKFGLQRILCVHRIGPLAVGETAVWLGAASAHREAAFAAVSRAMDEIKATVPIWKREIYEDGESAWILCRHPGHAHAPT